MFFLPTAVSWVVIGFISVRFFADQGILQSLLDNTGLGFLHPNMLSHERSALVAVMITFIWSMFGTNLIIFLAGMATIDQEIYDAARVDGAGSLTVMFRITFPLLKRFVQFTFIISLITAFSALFSLIYVMTGGGPDTARRRSSSTSTSRRSPRATSASERRQASCSSPPSSRSACCSCGCCEARTDV